MPKENLPNKGNISGKFHIFQIMLTCINTLFLDKNIKMTTQNSGPLTHEHNRIELG